MAVHERTIEVDAPLDQVFRMWENFENFPNFMSHVKEVKMLDRDKSHWRASIAGVEEEWDAVTTKMEKDRAIGWKSISGLENSGEVRFQPVDNRTQITVHIEYTPPAGLVGRAAEAVYVGREFEEELEEDLKHFKTKVEAT